MFKFEKEEIKEKLKKEPLRFVPRSHFCWFDFDE